MTAPTPPIPSFVDGVLVDHQDLQDLSDNLADLYALTMAGFRTRRPMVAARVTSAQTVASGGDTLLSFATQEYDTDAMFAPTSSIITVVTPGVYACGFSAHLAPVTSGAGALQMCRMTRNSTAPASGAIAASTSPLESGIGSSASCATKLRLAAGDVLRCYVRQNSGNATSVFLTYGGARAFAHWLHP